MEYLVGFIISIAITIFLVIDAPKHNKSPVLWGILGFVFGLLGLGIYLIVTDRKALGWIIVGLIILFVIAAFILSFFAFTFMFSGY